MKQIQDSLPNFGASVSILVTGGAGFIGCHLVEALLRQWPFARITVFDKFTYAVLPNAFDRLRASEAVEVITGDVCDRVAVQSAMKGKDLVFHLAAESHVPHSFENPELFDYVNRFGTAVVAAAACEANVKRLVHFSTDEVYGPVLSPASECHPLAPSTPYAASKAAGETMVIAARTLGLDAIILRPSNAVGCGQHPEKLFPRFIERCLGGLPLGLEGTGMQRRTFVSVRDLVRAAIHIACFAPRNSVFNIAGMDDLSIHDTGKRIGEVLKRPVSFTQQPDRAVNDAAYSLDGTALRALGFVNQFTLDDEIREISREYSTTGRPIVSPPKLEPSLKNLEPPVLPRVLFHVAHRAAAEARNVADVLASGRLMAGGAFSSRAQALLLHQTGAHAVHLTHSCTAAMEAAIMALGISAGDEVIVPSFTFSATATAAMRTGAKLVLCDVDPATLMLNADTVRARLSSRTRAVIAVHYGGAAAPVGELKLLGARHSFHLIEDAAQAVGAFANGRAIGTSGIFGALSFHDTKVIGCGHGGALLCNTDDAKLLRRVQTIIDRGTDFADKQAGLVDFYQWVSDGSSFRMPELNAAILAAQLDELDTILEHRRSIAALYKSMLDRPSYPWSMLAGNNAKGSNNHIFALLARDVTTACSLLTQVQKVGIACETHYAPLHLSPQAQRVGCAVGDFRGTNASWRRLVRLPIHTGMSIADAARVASSILAAINAQAEPATIQ